LYDVQWLHFHRRRSFRRHYAKTISRYWRKPAKLGQIASERCGQAY